MAPQVTRSQVTRSQVIRPQVAVEHTTENQVSAAVVRYMQARGWIADRVQVGLFYTKDGRPIPIGKPGQPDWRFKHPQLGYCEIEMKRPGEEPGKRQLEYLATMLVLGFKVTWTDGAGFEIWYRENFGA